MAIEIERKFLVKNKKWQNDIDRSVSIKQGYLNVEPERTVRIRTSNEKAFLTVKGKSNGFSRTEFEYDIPHEDALELLLLCQPSIIEKTRHYIIIENHTWELDVFEGDNQGLILAEIELDSEDEKFVMPDWVGEEVTEDIRYYNSHLSKAAFGKW